MGSFPGAAGPHLHMAPVGGGEWQGSQGLLAGLCLQGELQGPLAISSA